MKMIIQNIISDGYERFIEVKTTDNKVLIAHYIEYSEYLNDNDITKIRNLGDIISAKIYIDLVSNSYVLDKELNYIQEIDKSSSIKAIIKVKKVIDEYTILAQTSLCEEDILVEFEEKMIYQQFDKVYIEGSLEIDTPETCC